MGQVPTAGNRHSLQNSSYNVSILSREFYLQPTVTVARQILGARLVHMLEGVRLEAMIIEAEAYVGEEDLACHARSGRTARNAAMYGPPGHAYVYFTYGNHWMMNAVTEQEGFPAAVLLRAIRPMAGWDIMQARRKGRDMLGPGKLTQAMGLDGSCYGKDLCDQASGLWIEAGEPPNDADIISTPRIGLNTVPEPWRSKPWRFLVR